MRYLTITIWFAAALMLAACGVQDDASRESRESRELTISDSLDAEAKQAALEEQTLNDSTWVNPRLRSGSTPAGFDFTPRRDKKLDNYLEIKVGSNTDVVVKLMNRKTDQCIRYVFVRSLDTYRVKNIPEGIYYLKIAYGRNWRQKEIDGKLVGKFVSNALYKIGSEDLDYNIIYHTNSYQIPSYQVSLDVMNVFTADIFETEAITEEEFNK